MLAHLKRIGSTKNGNIRVCLPNVASRRYAPGSINQQPRQPWLGDQRNLGGTKGMFPKNHCSVPQILFMVPPKSLFRSSNSIYGPSHTIVLSPQIWPSKIIVLSPQISFIIVPKIILSPQDLFVVPHFGSWMNRSSVYALFVADPICRDLRAFGGTNQAINLW